MVYSRFLALVSLLVLLSPMGFPVTAYPQVTTLTVKDAVGVGSACTTVDVSLDHLVGVKGVQLEICDEGNFLVALGCSPAARAPAGTSCTTNELASGCASIILASLGGEVISPGTGPVFTISYGVFWDAPVLDDINTPDVDESSRLLIPNNVRVADENGDPLPSVSSLPGSIHFTEAGCTNDNDCPDDGLFCNGVQVCLNNECTTVDPCPAGSYCDEDIDECREQCSTDQECDDGLFCNGPETCAYLTAPDAFICTPGVSSCTDPTPLCDEANDICVECLDDTECDDGLFCNGTETCVAGTCQAGTPACPPLSICDEGSGECLCSSDADCDDGLYCNGSETCGSFSGTCDLSFNYLSDSPCLDCRPNLDDCECDELNDACLPAVVTIENSAGLPGSTNSAVPVSLDTLSENIVTIQMDVCDEDNLLACTGCDIAGRTPSSYACYATEQADGCCRVILVDVFATSLIDAGTGPVCTLYYDVSPGAPAGQCRPINPMNIALGGSQIADFAVDPVPGNFCFSAAAQASFSASVSELSSTAANSTPASTVDSRDQAGVEVNALGRDLWGELFGNAGSDDALFPFAISETCPFVASLDDPEELAVLRGFRDKVLSQNISGIIFTFLFYRNAPELARILDQHNELQEKVRSIVNEYSSLIYDVSNGGTAYLLESDRSRIIELLEEVKAKGSPQLTADIDLVIEEINAGTIGELCGIIIDD